MALTEVNSKGIKDADIATGDIAADAITGAKIADNAIDSEHYTDGSIDTAHIADDQITLAKMAGGTDGQIITYDANGDPVAVGPGTDGQVLTSTGAGSPPAFEDVAAGAGGATGTDYNDDVKVRFGTGNDVEYYWDHGASKHMVTCASQTIQQASGWYYVRAGNFSVYNEAGTETVAKFLADGACELYHNNSKKLETVSDGVCIGKSTIAIGTQGITFLDGGEVWITKDGSIPLSLNRGTNDGELVRFHQGGTNEGNISVSGSTISYNGGHLSRWSQFKGLSTTDKSARPTIYRGTVLSNLDDMCVWSHAEIAEVLYDEDVLYTQKDADAGTLPSGKSIGDIKNAKGSVKTAAVPATTEPNDQLNMTKVSDVVGDKDVAGVFWEWDNDAQSEPYADIEDYVNDFYIAMTGDMVIRVAGTTSVARGDLLISAGDGTAKPQTDDIIRSSTIAKIISTNSTETYADGSKAYPCVLMAC